ncbi:MAG: hypothetical protein Q8Q67_03540 [bacterium]|nr:hypothetical protein [bacterium]
MSNQEGQNQEEARKLKILKIGVWSFSIILLVIWLVSLRFSVGKNISPASSADANAWQAEFSETISTIRQSLETATTDETASSTEVTEKGREFIEDLKNGVENMKPAVDTEDISAATSTEDILNELEKRLNASTTPVIAPEVVIPKTSCPEYINCMPTIGEARPCLIPPGCENYTQIAY